jgi:hypothetical protein
MTLGCNKIIFTLYSISCIIAIFIKRALNYKPVVYRYEFGIKP